MLLFLYFMKVVWLINKKNNYYNGNYSGSIINSVGE